MANKILPIRNRKELTEQREAENSALALQNEMNRLFDHFFSEPFAPLSFYGSRWEGDFSPRVDVTETDNDFKVVAELPGLDEKDIEISLEQNALVLKGEKKSETEEKGRTYHRLERSYGSFERVIPLDEEIIFDKVEANFKNGVLTISLPKSPASLQTGRKIQIKTS